MKINKKGFTLIELLAVIVILGIIMVIAVPMVQEYILKSRKEGFTKTANGVIDAANLYYSNEAANNTSNSLDFTCTTKECKTTTNEKLDLKGKPDKGTIKVFGDGEIIACFQRDTWYAVKNINDKEAKFGEGTCEYNEETKSYDTIKLVSQEKLDELQAQLQAKEDELQALNSKINKTTASAEDIATGKVAYTKDGLVTGNSTKTEMVYLGKGSSFNIKELYPDIYSKLTVDNFIAAIDSAGVIWWDSNASYVFHYPNVSYNSETGILTITNNGALGGVLGTGSGGPNGVTFRVYMYTSN